MIRIGRSASIRREVLDISLDTRVENFVKCPPEQLKARLHAISKELALITNHIRQIQDRIRAEKQRDGSYNPLGSKNNGLAIELVQATEAKLRANTESMRCRWALEADRTRDSSREIATELIRKSFLNQANIVFSTLSGAGQEAVSHLDNGFDSMVIDEAAQSVELSLLVALLHNVHHCVLVGDPMQLPATVIMHSNNARLYERYIVAIFRRYCQRVDESATKL
jgi:senataxin